MLSCTRGPILETIRTFHPLIMLSLQFLKDFDTVIEVLRFGVELAANQNRQPMSRRASIPQEDATMRPPSLSSPSPSLAEADPCGDPREPGFARGATWTRPERSWRWNASDDQRGKGVEWQQQHAEDVCTEGAGQAAEIDGASAFEVVVASHLLHLD